MATYLQQNLHFQPCPPSTIKKSFEKVLKDVGAKKAPALGEQCWSLGKNVIFYSIFFIGLRGSLSAKISGQ